MLNAGFLNNVEKDQKVEVEFRKSSTITVKYLDEETEKQVASDKIITGFDGDGKEYTIEEIKKAVPFYKESTLGVTDEKKNIITENLKIYADAETYTVICWYKQTDKEHSIIIKHIEVTEEDKENGLNLDEGIVLEEKVVDGKTVEGTLVEDEFKKELETTRNKLSENYIYVDGPTSSEDNIIIVGKDKTKQTVEFVEDQTIEVRYYYEKQYTITAEVKKANESSETNGDSIKGNETEAIEGTVTPAKQEVLAKGNNKEIEIIPEYGYRVKSITINGEKLLITSGDKLVIYKSATDGTEIIKLKAGYFTKVDENKNIVVEFEKVPAKVIVKYIDIETNKEIVNRKEVNGYVKDDYAEERVPIEGYTEDGKEPTNKQGKMTEEPITITFYYKKIQTKDEENKDDSNKEQDNTKNNTENNTKENTNEAKDEKDVNKEIDETKTDKNTNQNTQKDTKTTIKTNTNKTANNNNNNENLPQTGQTRVIYASLIAVIVVSSVAIAVIVCKIRKNKSK